MSDRRIDPSPNSPISESSCRRIDPSPNCPDAESSCRRIVPSPNRPVGESYVAESASPNRQIPVWHDGLIFKLEQNGISGDLLRFFQNYLSNRKQLVVLNGSYSDYSSIESGVPRDSVLVPLLFLAYINDLERNIKFNVKLFADDMTLCFFS